MKIIALVITLLTLSCGRNLDKPYITTEGANQYFSSRNISAGHLSGAVSKAGSDIGDGIVDTDKSVSKYFTDRNVTGEDLQNFENKVASDTEMGAMDTKGYFKSKYKAIVIGDADERTAINEDRRRLSDLEARASESEGRLSSAESRLIAEEAKSAAQALLIDQMRLATELEFLATKARISDAEQSSKDYADENDSDTVFDDGTIQAAIDLINNLTIPTLADRVTDAEGAITALKDDLFCTVGTTPVTVVIGNRELLNGNAPDGHHTHTAEEIYIPTVTCPGV